MSVACYLFEHNLKHLGPMSIIRYQYLPSCLRYCSYSVGFGSFLETSRSGISFFGTNYQAGNLILVLEMLDTKALDHVLSKSNRSSCRTSLHAFSSHAFSNSLERASLSILPRDSTYSVA